jgi:hypothetical protein
MKKLLPIVVLLVLFGTVWMLTSSNPNPTAPIASNNQSGTAQPASSSGTNNDHAAQSNNNTAMASLANRGGSGTNGATEEDQKGEGEASDDEIRPATEVYKSAEEALEAVKKGSLDYDDLVLEQFTSLGDCKWCDGFYKSLQEQMLSPTSTPDQQSYFAELLAVSGRVDNVKTLVESIKNAPSQAVADAYSEALELASGKDDVVTYLGNELESSPNDNLKEALIAAVTNQGSRLAASILYKQAVESGSPDGYYSLGIGLGELIPDEDAIPYLQDVMLKRDQYSHLAVKSLLNGGIDGLRMVFDALTNSKDPEFDRQMLKDAVDHVNYDPDVEVYLKKIATSSKQPVASEFAKQIIDDFGSQAEDESTVSSDDEGKDGAAVP